MAPIGILPILSMMSGWSTGEGWKSGSQQSSRIYGKESHHFTTWLVATHQLLVLAVNLAVKLWKSKTLGKANISFKLNCLW